MFRRKTLCRRKYKTLYILLIIAVCYYFLQFFSLRKLTLWNGTHDTEIKTIHDLSAIDDEDVFKKEAKKAEKNLKKISEENWNKIHGVHVNDAKYYVPDVNGSFTCLRDKMKIDFSLVNDDYCDCIDYSDEPGTNACPHSKFYCKYQIPEDKVVFITGSKVNDGICDCCDGSDEWNEHKVPEHHLLLDKVFSKRYSVYQTPCENHCSKSLQMRARDERVKRLGVKLKEKYLLAGRGVKGTECKHGYYDGAAIINQLYGPENVFYKLSTECFTLEKTIYEYKICPFKSVAQVDFPQATFNLGQKPEWQKQEKGDYSLLMTQGEGRLCPQGLTRRTKIRFFCGLQDQPISITEEEKCLYVVKFITPAAC